jgi:hypothetical protein
MDNGRLACEAGVGIKPGAQAPGSVGEKLFQPVKRGFCDLILGLRPRLYAFRLLRRLKRPKFKYEHAH